MTRAAGVTTATLAFLAGTPALAAEAAAPAPSGAQIVLFAGLAITAAAIVAALVSMVRLRGALRLQHDIFGAVPQPRQVVDADGRTVLANAAFRGFFGRDDRPAPDMLAEIAGGAEARAQLGRLARNARDGVAGYMELRVRARADGNPAPAPREAEAAEWRYVAAYPLSERRGAVLWVIDDITLRRQMEQVIQEEQERFVDLLEYAPMGFYSVDGEGRFLFANRALCEWLGLSREELEDGRVRLHQILADGPPAGAPAHDPLGGRGGGTGEVALKGSDGGRFEASISQDIVADEAGRVLRTRSVVRNLSRERAMAEALERSAERFERFFVEAPVGIALLDREGRLTECNRAFGALIGSDRRDLAGTSLFDSVRPEDRPAVETALRRAGSGGAGPETQAPVEVHVGPAGETVCAMYVTGVSEATGAAGGCIAHFIDTTERKNLEVQFAQSQKMQAVGQLAGGIAHDFNNLLTAMIGFSDLLLLRHRPGDQSFADIMQIKQNANRAANLVRQLLAFSRQQTLQPRMLDVTDSLAELSHLLRRLIGENIELKMVHGRDLGAVRADQGQLEQVIINLAVNARDAMPEGGTLTITTGNRTLETARKAGTEVMPPGDYVLIEVADTGCGIPEDNLDRIFDPFFSTKEVGAGTGLGLSTVYGIVKQTGGFVFVRSAPGRGSTFSIYLPQQAAEAAAAAGAEVEAKARRDLTGMGTIMLVEDEDAVRSFSARVLRSKGYEVLEARSGESALDLLKDRVDSIDLLVTDVVMPRVDGPTLVREVRQRRPDLKVIFISGYTEDAFRKRLGEDADIHFLPKPFSLKQLAGKVKEVMATPAVPVARRTAAGAAGPRPGA